MALTMMLTVGQFRRALQLETPVIHEQAAQDKIETEHCVKLHAEVVKVLRLLNDGRADSELRLPTSATSDKAWTIYIQAVGHKELFKDSKIMLKWSPNFNY